MTTWKLEHSDVIEWAKGYTGEPFHAMLTDCPYHLTSITKRFGKEGSAPAKGDVYRRASAGFMGSRWDGGDIAFQPATWAALSQHLYPGAFIMAFGGSRGYHRMATAMEDAGLIIHPAMGWLTLSGFPKATRIKGYGSPNFSGHRYGLQSLKPAFEFIAVAQVPYSGRPLDSIVATGAGALNIEQARIPTNGETPKGSGNPCPNGNADIMSRALGKDSPNITPEAGRWPANFLLTHHVSCNGDCHPDCPVRLFDEQAGERPSSFRNVDKTKEWDTSNGVYKGGIGKIQGDKPYTDSGPASRMFHRSSWQYEVAEQLANAEPVRYEPKVSSAERDAGLDGFEEGETQKYGSIRKDRGSGYDEASKARNNHPTLKPISLTKYLATLLLPPAAYAPRRILVPFSGVSSEMIGCVLAGWESVTGIESNAAYAEIGEARLRWWSQWPGWGQTDVDAILAVAKVDDVGQMSLFDEPA